MGSRGLAPGRGIRELEIIGGVVASVTMGA